MSDQDWEKVSYNKCKNCHNYRPILICNKEKNIR